MGNILQSYLFKNHLNKEIKFVGYKVPHPLETKCIVRIELNNEDKPETKIKLVKTLMINTIDYINSIVISLKNEWDSHHNITTTKDIKPSKPKKPMENKTIEPEIDISSPSKKVEEIPKKKKKLKIVNK